MELFQYSGYIYNERVVGIVRANNIKEAEQILETVYDDYSSWATIRLTKVEFENNICEIYYGG